MERNLTVSSADTVKTRCSKIWHVRHWFSTGQAYLYLLPAFIILAIFFYAPSAFVFYMSLFNWSFLRQGSQPFIGLANYAYLMKSSTFWQAVRVTVVYVVISVPLQLFLALVLALFLMPGIRGRAFWRLAIFAPFITPLVATTTIWLWMFDRYHGFFNGIAHLLHLSAVDWLGDPRWTLFSVILYTTWKYTGFSVVLFMAGLGNISPSLSEAARVDGAHAGQILCYIIWPLLTPITLVVLLLTTIESFKMFQPAFLLTNVEGGTGNVVQTLGLYLFSEGFSTNPRDGRGAAISVLLFLLVFTISIAQLFLMRQKDYSMD